MLRQPMDEVREIRIRQAYDRVRADATFFVEAPANASLRQMQEWVLIYEVMTGKDVR